MFSDDPDRAARLAVLSVIVAAAAATACAVASEAPRKQVRGQKRRRHAFQWDDFLADLTPTECKRLFRMPQHCIHELHDLIGHRLETAQPEMGVRGCGHSISSMHRLLAALAYFAGAIPPYI